MKGTELEGLKGFLAGLRWQRTSALDGNSGTMEIALKGHRAPTQP